MKRKMALLLTTCLAVSLLFSTVGAFAAEMTDEETDGSESEVKSEELNWDVEQISSIPGILSGMENKEYTSGTAHKYDIHMGVNYDKDIIAGVLFNTADIDFNTSGEYDVTYFVYFNREALLDYMEENGIDASEFSGLTDAIGDRLEVVVNGKVTISGGETSEATYEEPVYEEPVYEEPVYEEPVYEEPVYEEPVYEEPVYEEPVYEEPVYEEPVDEGPYEVSRDTVYDCDGSGNGYYIIHWSDGSETYVDF